MSHNKHTNQQKERHMRFFRKEKKLPEPHIVNDSEALRSEIIEACKTVFAREGRMPDSIEIRKLVRANHVIINQVIGSWWPSVEAKLPKAPNTNKLVVDDAEMTDGDTKQALSEVVTVPNVARKKEKVRVRVRKYDGEH